MSSQIYEKVVTSIEVSFHMSDRILKHPYSLTSTMENQMAKDAY